MLMGTSKAAVSYAGLYYVTYSVPNFAESNLTRSGSVALIIIFLSLPASFFLTLWAFGGLPRPDGKIVVRSAVIAAVISPFSFMLWLTIYVNMVGYRA